MGFSSKGMVALSPTDHYRYCRGSYTPGRSRWVQLLWYVTSAILFQSPLFPLSRLKCLLLRCFGASVGNDVVIKPGVRIKFPWRLALADRVWIGEDAWIDNLAEVVVGNDCCISQGAYLCTGSHDFRKVSFDLITKPIRLEPGVWIGARAVVLPGVTIGAGSILSAGSVAARDVGAMLIINSHGTPSTRKREMYVQD